MSDIVTQEDIENLIGAPRHQTKHLARFYRESGSLFIMHSQECFDSGFDLRDCEFSVAMDKNRILVCAHDVPLRIIAYEPTLDYRAVPLGNLDEELRRVDTP